MKSKFKKIIEELIHKHNTPSEIALGAGIGAFICCLPLYGLHTLLVVVAAILVRRANKIAIFLGTNLSLPPTVPFITLAAYEIGRFILKGKYPPLNWDFFNQLTFSKILNLYWPLFLGSVILGIFCGLVVYGATYLVVRQLKRKA